MIPLSVVILTKNEEKNIKDCLESVYGWANEIIVVDDESTDKTIDITRNYTDKIFSKKMLIEGTHRNWAYQQAKNDWVLSLDADERVLPELKKEISDLFENKKLEFDAYTIPRRNFIGNYWVKYGGWYPSAQLRLFKKDKFKYEEVEVHPRAFLEGPCGHLTSDMLHFSYRDFEDFLNKLNRQTTQEATKWFRTNRQMSLGRALWRTHDRFWRTFLSKKSYKDGFTGFMIAVFASLYQIVSYAKFRQMKNLL